MPQAQDPMVLIGELKVLNLYINPELLIILIWIITPMQVLDVKNSI